jgi:hypothetical protein
VTIFVVAVFPCTPAKERSNFDEVAVVAVACLASNSMTARGVGAGARASSSLGGQAKHGEARRRAEMIEFVGRMMGGSSGERLSKSEARRCLSQWNYQFSITQCRVMALNRWRRRRVDRECS